VKTKARLLLPACLVGIVGVGYIVAISPVGDFLFWQIDLVTGYRKAFPTEKVRGYEVTLMQTPGGDFYDSYFLLKDPKGNTYRVVVDGDDFRWKNPQTQLVGRKLYYLVGKGEINDRTSYLDLDGLVYAGYSGRTFIIPPPKN